MAIALRSLSAPSLAMIRPKASATIDASVVDARPRPSPKTSISLNLKLAGMVADGPFSRQIFPIRSYDVGADENASMETFVKHFQETSISHFPAHGLPVDGYGTTPEMFKRDLVWVTTRMHVVVDIYPSWGDVVEVECWFGKSGNNGIKREWQVRDFLTGNTIARASSVILMMNKVTRKMSKIPDEVKAEMDCFLVARDPIIAHDDIGRIPKLDLNKTNCVQQEFVPHWGDLDMNQHVNNVKYINWIIEGVPISVLEDYELVEMKLEYRRECLRNNVLKSITSVKSDGISSSTVECHHLLQLEDGSEIMRGWTTWKTKLNTAIA